MAFLDYCGNAPLFGNRRDVALAPFATVGGGGWSVDYAAAPAALLPLAGFTVSRLGYDASGTPTRYAERLTATRRVRQSYPNQALSTAVSVALSDYVYADDTVLGRINGSTETSPKPIAAWAQADRTVVGASLTVDIIAFHRNARGGKPVACIAGTASDGSVTVTASTTTPIVLGHAGDRNAVVGYRLTFDLSALADNANVIVNAKVYPWIGGSSSVLDSSVGTAGARGFTPQTFRRATALVAAPVYAYVNATSGVDATVNASGQSTADVTKVKLSTTPATAAANPF